MLDDKAARHIEVYLNQARLVLIGCLIVLANRGFLPDSTGELILLLAAGGLAWFLVVGLLARYLYRPWVAIAIALVDVANVSALVYLTGGPNSPLDSLYAIVVFAAILRLTRLHSILFVLTSVAFYVLAVGLHPSYQPDTSPRELLSRATILGATGFLAWLIAAEVHRQRGAILEAEQQLNSLTTISRIVRRLGSASERDEIVRQAALMVDELMAPRCIAAGVVGEPGKLHCVAALGPGFEPDGLGVVAPSASDEFVAALIRRGCVDVIEVPITVGHQTLAWLFVGVTRRQPLALPDRALLERLADETAAALQRIDLLERERERSRSLARLADENGQLLERERQTVARMRQLATHKDTFIDMVAHELRTPLTSIKGFAQLQLRGANESGGGSRYTNFILGESNRLMGIIDDIVDLSRMERGLLEMHWQEVDVAMLLREVAAMAYPSGVHAAVDLAPELRPVSGDPDKLRQSLVNLLQTGAKYHQADDPMHVSARLEGDQVLIELRVAGTVPEQRLSHIFAHLPTEEDDPARSGLGLYICKNFVEAHGGKVWIEGDEAGARFLLQLPGNAVDASPDVRIPEPNARASRRQRLSRSRRR
jgi:signal transduction histidine kinase